jgi:hypothetical protein
MMSWMPLLFSPSLVWKRLTMEWGTGSPLSMSTRLKVAVFEVRRSGDAIEVRVPPAG